MFLWPIIYSYMHFLVTHYYNQLLTHTKVNWSDLEKNDKYFIFYLSSMIFFISLSRNYDVLKRKKMFFSETIRLMWINLDINSSWVFLILIYQFVWILSKMAPVTWERKFLIGSKSPFLEPIFFPTWLRFPLDLSRFSFFFGGQFYTIVYSSWLWRWVILKVKIIKNLLLWNYSANLNQS